MKSFIGKADAIRSAILAIVVIGIAVAAEGNTAKINMLGLAIWYIAYFTEIAAVYYLVTKVVKKAKTATMTPRTRLFNFFVCSITAVFLFFIFFLFSWAFSPPGVGVDNFFLIYQAIIVFAYLAVGIMILNREMLVQIFLSSVFALAFAIGVGQGRGLAFLVFWYMIFLIEIATVYFFIQDIEQLKSRRAEAALKLGFLLLAVLLFLSFNYVFLGV